MSMIETIKQALARLEVKGDLDEMHAADIHIQCNAVEWLTALVEFWDAYNGHQNLAMNRDEFVVSYNRLQAARKRLEGANGR